MEVGKREIVYLSLHRDHQNENDSCIKMGRDESHFSISLIVRDKVKRLRILIYFLPFYLAFVIIIINKFKK